MQKLIIVNANDAGMGKTTALRCVYDAFCAHGYQPNPVAPPKGDLRTIFDVNQHKVGLETMGDPTKNHAHKKSLTDFVQIDHCEIIITASRRGGEPMKDVEWVKEQGYEILWMNHDRTNLMGLRLARNKEYSERVVKTIEDWTLGIIP